MLESILKLIVPAIAFWAVGTAMRRYALTRMVRVDPSGTTSIWPSFLCYGSIGTVCVAFGMFAWTQSGRTIEPAASVFMLSLFGCIGFATFLRAHPAFAIKWDDTGIKGPGGYFWPKKRRLDWESIESLKRMPSGYWQVTDDRQKSIVWTELFCGWPALVATLVVLRPDLFPPKDLKAWQDAFDDADREQ